MSDIKIVAIIPARMASSRFPGKPLLSIEGLPMIEHVRRRTLLCGGFSEVVVATCDVEIASVVEHFGGKVVMTAASHKVATERLVEAMQSLDCTHIVNVQGDEILILPEDLQRVVKTINKNPEGPMWNAVSRVEHADELKDTSIVKCILSESGQIFYASRNFSQLSFSIGSFEPVYWLIGILAYTRKFLRDFSSLHQGPLEKMESIEQLRCFENDISIISILFQKAYPGINEPREIAIVEKYLKEDPLQRKILEQIKNAKKNSFSH